jgi:hypothetical protein
MLHEDIAWRIQLLLFSWQESRQHSSIGEQQETRQNDLPPVDHWV